MAADNTTLGRFQLIGIPAAPRGMPQIEVTFDIDANGILNVTAKDMGTGKEQAITISAPNKLSKDDIDKRLKKQKCMLTKIKRNKKKLKSETMQIHDLHFRKTVEDLKDKISDEENRHRKINIGIKRIN